MRPVPLLLKTIHTHLLHGSILIDLVPPSWQSIFSYQVTTIEILSSSCNQTDEREPSLQRLRISPGTAHGTALWSTLLITTTRLLIEFPACQREVSLLLSRPCSGYKELDNICLLWIDVWIDLTRMAPIKTICPPTRCDRRDYSHQGATLAQSKCL